MSHSVMVTKETSSVGMWNQVRGPSTVSAKTCASESRQPSRAPFSRVVRTRQAEDDSAGNPLLNFSAAWSAWRAHRASGSRPIANSTLADYDSMYRCFLGPFFGDLLLAEIDAEMVGDFQLDMLSYGVSAVRYGKVVVPLRACLRWHFRNGTFPHDTTFLFDKPAPPADERRVLSFEEFERLLNALPDFYRPHVAFAAYTGLRLGELRALCWQYVYLDRGIVHVRRVMDLDTIRMYTKTKSSRSVGLPGHIRELLTAWQGECPASDQNLVFPQSSGRVLEPSDFRKRVFRPALVRAGLNPAFRIHDLRHTAASWYVHAGASVVDLMRVFGWSQMQTAMRYIHMLDTPATLAALLSESRETSLSAGPH